MTTDLDERLARLERTVRRQRWLGTALALAAAAGLFASRAGAQDPVSETPGVVLRDEEGRVRADLALAEGGAALNFYNEAGVAQGMVGIDARGPFFAFKDSEEKTRVQMELDGTRGLFALTDARGQSVYTKRW